MSKEKKVFLLSLLVGIPAGYALYYFFVMEVLTLLFGGGWLYLPLCLVSLAVSAVGSCALLYLLQTGTVKRCVVRFLSVAYFALLLPALFLREAPLRVFIWNPLVGLRDLGDWEMCLQSALNLLMFIPLGYFIHRWPRRRILLFLAVVPLGIELLQALSMRGMLDTFDALLYILGITLGVLLFRRFPLRVVD